jgi:Spy/CpxP family protein refolding chaperone
MKEVLTPEQFEKMQKHMQEKRGAWREKREHAGMRGEKEGFREKKGKS